MEERQLAKVFYDDTPPTEEEKAQYVCLRKVRSDQYNNYYAILSRPDGISMDDVYKQTFDKTCFGYRVVGGELVVYID